MKIIVRSLVIGFMNIVAYEAFGQLAVNSDKNLDTTRTTAVKTSTPTRIYNDLPRMPKKKEPANKLFREDKKQIGKGAVKRKYKHEKRAGIRSVKKQDSKHGIIAERKKKDKMFK
jgi:hypothetical protein